MQARLFATLRPQYQRCGQLRLRIRFQKLYLDSLMKSGEEEAQEVQQAHEQAREQTEREY